MPRRKPEANTEYTRRIDWVIDHVRENLDRQLKLEELAKVACFSEFHFHRIFGAVTGETLKDFTNRVRLEKAARLLRFSGRSLTDIAMDCGFSSSATFSRAFRAGYDTTASLYRKTGVIKKSKIREARGTGQECVIPMSTEAERKACPVKWVVVPA